MQSQGSLEEAIRKIKVRERCNDINTGWVMNFEDEGRGHKLGHSGCL